MIAASRAILAAALLAMLALDGARGAGAAEVIHRFDSVVSLAKDGTLTVTETVRVRAEGAEIKRGIYRDFPLYFKDAGGTLREVTFDLIDVTRDGKPEPHFTKREGNAIRIYAGKEDVIVPRGDHTYVFRYRTARQVRWFDGKPELNWNVTGNFWRFPMLIATYRLELDGGARPLRWTAFTGRVGERGTAWRGGIGADGVLTVATTRPLMAGEGFTVVAEIPAGAVEPPSAAAEFWYTLRDNRHWIIGALGFGLVFAYYLAAWSAVGRDPRRGIVIPLFHPPEGISPALANYIDNWGLSREKWRAFTAAALSLAVRGLITFDEKDGKLILKVKDGAPADAGPLPAGERAILTWVKGQGVSAVISKANGVAVANVAEKFTTAIEGENRNRFFRRNLGYVFAGIAMTVAVVVGILVFGGLRDEDILIMVGMGFAGFMLGMFIVPVLLTMFGAESFSSLVRSALSLIVLGLFASLAVVFLQAVIPGGVGEALPWLWSLAGGHPFPIALVTAFATLNGLFVYLMRAPTALGRPIMDKLEGFKLYLETAEKDRLNLQAPEITAERFEALLPYAVALDVEKPWSEAFSAALSRAHPGDADPMHHYRPSWSSGGSWSGASIGSAVASTVAGVSGAFASAVPASSGSSGFSSGGGGSGGGGGGGGGGGW